MNYFKDVCFTDKTWINNKQTKDLKSVSNEEQDRNDLYWNDLFFYWNSVIPLFFAIYVSWNLILSPKPFPNVFTMLLFGHNLIWK